MSRTHHAALLAAVGMLVAFLIGPAPHTFGLTTRADAAAREMAIEYNTAHAPITWVGFFEDSLVFLNRGMPSITEPDALPDWFDLHPTGIAVVSDQALNKRLSLYTSHDITQRSTIIGEHYTKGRRETLHLFSRQPITRP